MELQINKNYKIIINTDLEDYCFDCDYFERKDDTRRSFYLGQGCSSESLEENTITCKNINLCRNKYNKNK